MDESRGVGEAIEAWLHGEQTQGEWRKVMARLDMLYANGPKQRLADAAKQRLKKALAEARNKAIFYGALDGTLIGNLWVASCEESVIALDIGTSEAQFIARLDRSFGKPLFHSPESIKVVLRQLQEYLTGSRRIFELGLSLNHLTDYQCQVLRATLNVPYGQATTYGEIARRIGRSGSARAVGQVLAHNPIPIVIPCHRILGADGSLHGYSGGRGIETKAQLLRLEGVLPFDTYPIKA